MKPAERIKIIKEISEKMVQEEWPMVDLILRQFQLPTSDMWNGNKDSYIINMIDQASDSILVELGGYYGIGNVRSQPVHSPDFWEDNYYRLFISHRSSDKAEVTALQAALLNCGISAFVAHKDIKPSKEWLSQIELALRTCDGLLAYLTDKFHGSQWTDQEVGFAIARGVRVIPLNKGQLPYGFMGKYQALNTGSMTTLHQAIEIMKVAMTDSRTGASFAELITHRLAASKDYGTSSNCMTAIEALPLIKPEELQKLKSAFNSNKQFSGVGGMTGRMKRLFQKFGQTFN